MKTHHNKKKVHKEGKVAGRVLKKNSASAYAAKCKNSPIECGARTSAKTLMRDDVAEMKEIMVDVVSTSKPLGL